MFLIYRDTCCVMCKSCQFILENEFSKMYLLSSTSLLVFYSNYFNIVRRYGVFVSWKIHLRLMSDCLYTFRLKKR